MKIIRRASMALMMMAGLMILSAPGCATPGQEEDDDDRPGDLELLQEEARGFHSNMRWGRYEHAADAVHEAYLGTFEGEYEERGDDYEIVDLTFKKVDLVEEGQAAIIEVEQEWFQLPSTTVEKERFVERWIYEEDRWWMRERLLRSDYRDRDSTFDSEPREEDEEQAVQDEDQAAAQ